MGRIITLNIWIFLIPVLAVSQSTTYQYDQLDRLIKEEYSNGTFVSYTYDDIGNRSSVIVEAVTQFEIEDLNQDGKVDETDLEMMVEYIFDGTVNAQTDINRDGKVNVIDLMAIRLKSG